MARCVILSASPEFTATDIRPDDWVIACDGGYRHALASGIRPSLLVGDFDSLDLPLPEDIPVLRAPCEKDDTDTMLAIKLAWEKGYREFVLLGALGGRLDHALANLAAAAFLSQQGGTVSIIGCGCTVYALTDSSMSLACPGKTVSIFSFTDQSRGVTLTGFKYPLADATLTNSFALGESNIQLAEIAQITVKDGTLLICVNQSV